MRTAFLRASVVSLAALALASCVGDDDELITEVENPDVGGALFRRYVALGSSVAAGIQAGGLTDTLQLQAYPVLLAARAGAPFGVPLLAQPGCPTPFVGPFTRAPNLPNPDCALRREDDVPRFVQNVAVPQATVQQVLRGHTDPSLLTIQTFLLGAQTQMEAVNALRPTFVSVDAAQQDVWNAALAGILGPTAAGGDSLLTPFAAFQTTYTQLAQELASVRSLRGAVLIGVIDPVILTPLLQPGAYFFLARDPATGRFQGKPVNANCSPVTALGQPNPLAANMISFQAVSDQVVTELNCDPAAATMGGRYLLTTAEQLALRTRVTEINAFIAGVAADNDWAFVNPTVVFAPALQQTDANGRFQQVRKCQLLPTATNAAQFQVAVLNSCPVTGPTAAPNMVGALFSFDAVHPSRAAHVLLANAIAAAINTEYGTSLPTTAP